jgi:hypothetical protein
MLYNICPHCGGDLVLYRQINGNGSQVIVARCCKCDRIPNAKQPFLPKSDYPHWQEFPVYQDNTQFSEPCCVKGCERRDTEYHHFAPRHLFAEAADNWPTGWLCLIHHREWHEKTKTGMFAKRVLV